MLENVFVTLDFFFVYNHFEDRSYFTEEEHWFKPEALVCGKYQEIMQVAHRFASVAEL